MSTTPRTDAARSEEDEDSFNAWNRDITDYEPSLFDAYVFGLNRGRTELAAMTAERDRLAKENGALRNVLRLAAAQNQSCLEHFRDADMAGWAQDCMKVRAALASLDAKGAT